MSPTGTNSLEELEKMQNFCNSILNATHLVAVNELNFPTGTGNLGELRMNVNFGHSESQNLLEGGQIMTQNPREDPPVQNRKHQREIHSSDSSNSPKRLHIGVENDFGSPEEENKSHDVEMIGNEEISTPL